MSTWGDGPAVPDQGKPDRAEGLITLACLFLWVIFALWYLIWWGIGAH